MNSVKRQFGIILKLAVMLCLIGCFFIGKTSVVKADLDFVPISNGFKIVSDKPEEDNGKYNVTLNGTNYICEVSLPNGTGSSSVSVTPDSYEILTVAAEGDLYDAAVEFYVQKVSGGSLVPTGVNTKTIYKVMAGIDSSSSGEAQVKAVLGSSAANYGTEAVYGYEDSYVDLVASNFTTTMFDRWQIDGKSKTGDTKKYRYQIKGTDATSYEILWKLYSKDAANDILLNDGGDGSEFPMSVGSNVFIVKIDPDSYNTSIYKKKIQWSLEPGCKATITPDSSGNISINWPKDVYGSYVLTATLPNVKDDEIDGGALVTAYSLTRTATITSVTISGPAKAYVGVPAKYTVTSILPTGASLSDGEWFVDTTSKSTPGTVSVGSVFTYTPTSTDVGATKEITLQYDGGTASNIIQTKVEDTPTVSSVSISPDGVTVDNTAIITAKVSPTGAAQVFASAGAEIVPSDKDYFKVDSYSVSGDTVTIKVTGIKHATDKRLQFKVGTSTVADPKLVVYIKPKLEESSSSLKISLPDKVVIGSNSTEVTGFRLYAYKSDIDSPIYDSGDTYKSAGKTKTISAADINQIIKDKSGNFSGEQDTVKFVVVPMGHKNGSSDYSVAKTSDDKLFKSDEVSVNVYRASVSGNGIIGSSAYGIAGQKVTISAYPASGYASVKWSDGSTNPTKEVTLSTSTSANQLKAEGVLGAQNPNAAGGTGGANSGDMSGYDDVPKTAESNSAIWLIVFMVFAVMGTAYALYLQLKAATSKNDK